MKKEDYNVDKRVVSTTTSANVSLKIRTCQRISKVLALRLTIDNCSDTAQDINKTIIVISFSPRTKWRAEFSSPLRWFKKSWTHSSPSCTNTDLSGTTQTFEARLTIEAVSWIANSSSAELDSSSVNRMATSTSSEELAITDLAHDLGNELLHGGFEFFHPLNS